MRKFKRRKRHSLPFGLFLAVAAVLLLPAALAPRANADPTDYRDFENPLGSAPAPAQGVLINQPLAFNYNPTLALNNVASGAQPGGFQPLVPDALFSWTGATNSTWGLNTNWSPTTGPPGAGDTAVFDGAFLNQPTLAVNATIGELHMATGVAQNVSISSSADTLTINGVGGTGILVDNASGFNFTINTAVALGGAQAWTNNSGNLFTVTGTVNLSADALTVNGTGNTLITGIMAGGMGSTLTKADGGTLTLTAANTYDDITTVNGGTLLVDNTAGNGVGMGAVTVNSGGTLGGTGIITVAVTVNAGGTLAPGNGGNNTETLQITGALTLASTSNFKVDINGPAVGTGYDQIVAGGTVNVTGSNLMVHVGTTVSVGDMFTIVNKTSGGAVTGTFAGIPQGGTVVGDDGTVFTVSYVGGDGNDIVLTVQALVPEPSTWMGGALAIAGLAFTQRRRLRKLIARRCAVGSS